jgi:uncharacterized protein (DUF488 family)
MPDRVEVLTIGHSNHPLDHFLRLLNQHHVTAVADVRSSPTSRYSPQFNRGELVDSLRTNGIKYVFLGKELGARSEDPSCYEEGKVRYDRIACTQLFAEGIERVLAGASQERIAILCAEKDPIDCHRTVLVSRALSEADVAVQHILADGSLEQHSASMNRILAKFRLGDGDLFHTREELLVEALARQEAEIAYTRPVQAVDDLAST